VRKGEQTRQEIIRKAASIFKQKGYDGAALSDLMAATGLEKGGPGHGWRFAERHVEETVLNPTYR
jgi:hypothetical protein